jgi:hypothetical protein
MRGRTIRDAATPLVSSGVLMAAYLLLRPYGDQGGDLEAARAMASSWWVVSHVCGMLALASVAVAALRIADTAGGASGLVARWAGLGGVVLVLPYYGAETFALHVVARHARDSDVASMSLVTEIREQPVATSMFGLGLLLLAMSGAAIAIAWRRVAVELAWAGWPLGVLLVLFLPQFYLPGVGRMAYGVAYLVAASLLAVAVRRATGRSAGAGEGRLSVAGARIPA